MTDLRHDYVVTHICKTDRLDFEKVNRIYADFEAQGRQLLVAEGVADKDMLSTRFMDMRYVGQSFELTIPGPDRALDAGDMAEILARFHSEHERTYGHCAPEEPVEVANLKLSVTGLIPNPNFKELPKGGASPEKALRVRRKVYFAESGGFIDCPSYDRYLLAGGNVVEGPAIVEDKDATTVIHLGYRAEVGRFGDLKLTPLV